MNQKIKKMLNTRAKKAAAFAACTTLLLSLGAATAFAAGIRPDIGSFLIKNDGGNVSYSTDDGATWNAGAPDNYHVEEQEDGGILSWVGEAPPQNGDDAFAVKIENGITYYSTDGGATWSEQAPQGVEQTVNPDGSIGFSMTGKQTMPTEEGSILVQNDGGNVSYSTDDGATWNAGAPDNYHVEEQEDGGVLSWVGEAPPQNGDDAFAVKIENGITYYSTDGGATWSEQAPQGVEQTVNPDGSVNIRKK